MNSKKIVVLVCIIFFITNLNVFSNNVTAFEVTDIEKVDNLQTNTISNTLAPEPTIASKNQYTVNRTTTGTTVYFAPGNGSNRLIILRTLNSPPPVVSDGVAYTSASGFFGATGSLISAGNHLIANTSGNSTVITNLTPGSRYILTVIEYNRLLSGQNTENYLTSNVYSDTIATVLTNATIQVTNPVVSQSTTNSFKLKWTKGNGNKTFIVARKAANVNFSPMDTNEYSSSSVFGTSTAYNIDNFVVYDGPADSVVITNLQPYTLYYLMLNSYNDSSKRGYAKYNNGLNQLITSGSTLALEPTVDGTKFYFKNRHENGFNISFVKGNGAGRVLVMKAGSPVDRFPVDGVAYNGEPNSSNDLGNGNRVIYSVTGTANLSSYTISGLSPGTKYYFAVFEHNNLNYRTIAYNDSSESTIMRPPTLNSSFESIVSKTDSSITIKLTKGNGKKRLVLVNANINASNVFPIDTVRYTVNSNFGLGHSFSSGYYAVYADTGSVITVKNINHSTYYKFMWFDFNDSTAKGYENYFTFYVTSSINVSSLSPKPTKIANSFNFFGATESSREVKINGGNGKGKIVVASTNKNSTKRPINGTRYLASGYGNVIEDQAYLKSNYLGDSTFVVINRYPQPNSTDSIFTLYGLERGRIYYLRAYEYNGADYQSDHYTDSFILDSTWALSAEPSIQASRVNVLERTSTSAKIRWTKGNGEKSLVVLTSLSNFQLPTDGVTYTASSNLQNAGNVGSAKCVYNGTGNQVVVTGLKPDSIYAVLIFGYNGYGGGENYLTSGYGFKDFSTIALEPTMKSSNMAFNFSDLSNNLSVNFNKGNGSKRLVVYNIEKSITFTPVDTIEYTLSTILANNQKIAIVDSSTNFTISNITREKKYHFKVYEYNGSTPDAYNYNTSNAYIDSVMTLAITPTIGSSNLNFKLDTRNDIRLLVQKGNGNKRIIIARRGLPVSKTPKDGTYYLANAQFGNGANLGEDNFVVYSDTGNTVLVTNLQPNSTYYFSVVEYNGNNLQAKDCSNNYISTQITTGSFNTIEVEPTINASNIVFSNFTSNSATLSWTNGNGTARLVIMRADNPISNVPQDGNSNFVANNTFGFGSDLGDGNYVIYDGTGSSINIEGLNADRAYYATVIEYNGINQSTNYNTSGFVIVNNLAIEPTIASSNASVTSFTKTEIKFNFNKGNGKYRIVLAKSGENIIDKIPLDGKNYSANNTFGLGEDLGQGNFVVYVGESNSVDLKGLNDNTTYHFAVYEFNEEPIGPPNYLTSSFLRTAINTKTGYLGTDLNPNTKNLLVYPNPSAGNWFNIYIENEELEYVNAYDLLGRDVSAMINTIETSKGLFKVNTSLSSGIYYLHLKTKNGILQNKIIIENAR